MSGMGTGWCGPGSWGARVPSGALLPRHAKREFAVANAAGESFGESCRRLFAIGGDELGKGREQARLRQTVAVDPVDARFRPGFVQIAERRPLLLVLWSRLRNLDRVRCHGWCQVGGRPPRPLWRASQISTHALRA